MTNNKTIEQLVKEHPDNTKLREECDNSATDIAKYLLSLDPERKYFTDNSEGNFRLNTMLHISQMLHCSKTGKLLFKEPMIAFPPGYHKLSEEGQKELSEIYFNKDIKDKESQVRSLYKKENKEDLLKI